MVRVGLTPDSSSLLIRFDYDPYLVELTKQLPGRRFNKSLIGWVVPLTKELVEELQGRYQGAALTVLPEVKEKLDALTEAENMAQNIKSKDQNGTLNGSFTFPTTQPMAHQIKALELFAKRTNFAFLMEMGTGKTFVVLAGLRWLKSQGYRRFLVVCPASVMHVWEDQAKQHQPDLKVKLLMGPISKRKEELRNGLTDGTELFVINYEATWRMEEELQQAKFCALILDESTRIKNRTARQTKAIHRLGKEITRKYIMTGTPIPNTPMELYSQFYFLNPAILGSSFYAYRDRYAVMGGYQGYQVVSYKNTTELIDKIDKHSYRVLKSQCLDLPEKVYNIERLNLEGDQKQAYNELADDLVTEVQGSHVTAAVLVSKLIKLREILAGFIKSDDGTIKHFEKQAKITALLELIEDLPSTEKIVIWCLFREEMDMIAKHLKHLCLRLDGSTPMSQRGDIVKQFQEDKNIQFFIGQQRAGGLGIELTAATQCVFMTNDYSPEVRLQCEDRLHRKGQTSKVTYHDLLCKGTLDVTVRSALKRKQNLSDFLTKSSILQAVKGEI